MRWRAALLALLAVATGCASHPHAHSAAKRPAAFAVAPVSIQVVLPSRTITAGSQLAGRANVDNTTGHAIHVPSCGLPFMAALSSSTYHPTFAWAACLSIFTFPAGRSSFPLEILATYLACSPAGTPACLPGKHKLPPLPAGRYQARLYFQGKPFAPAPPAISVQVIPG